MAVNIVGFESLSITATAVGFSSIPNAAVSFYGRLETADIRVRHDGSDASSTTGVLVRAEEWIGLEGNELKAGSFIRDGSTSATLQGHFYSVPLLEVIV